MHVNQITARCSAPGAAGWSAKSAVFQCTGELLRNGARVKVCLPEFGEIAFKEFLDRCLDAGKGSQHDGFIIQAFSRGWSGAKIRTMTHDSPDKRLATGKAIKLTTLASCAG